MAKKLTRGERATEAVIMAGAKMSNLCFNLGQQAGEPLSERDAQIMRECCGEWDAAVRSLAITVRPARTTAKPRKRGKGENHG